MRNGDVSKIPKKLADIMDWESPCPSCASGAKYVRVLCFSAGSWNLAVLGLPGVDVSCGVDAAPLVQPWSRIPSNSAADPGHPVRPFVVGVHVVSDNHLSHLGHLTHPLVGVPGVAADHCHPVRPPAVESLLDVAVVALVHHQAITIALLVRLPVDKFPDDCQLLLASDPHTGLLDTVADS